MKLWTTFAPGKVTWELTKVQSKGKTATNNWQAHLPLIEQSLKKLASAGITGIRLAIYPSELTKDGKTFNWIPIETMLDLCHKTKIEVDLCIGPYQYPHYPGIFLPDAIRQQVKPDQVYLDNTKAIADYGMNFLHVQMKRYSRDKRIRGFHVANEWPDFQRISGKETIRIGISKSFMIRAAKYLVTATKKPLLMNTNIDAGDKQKLADTFDDMLTILGTQGKLGFDIYPSQESWMKTPLQKLRRLVEPYHKSFDWSRNRFPHCEIYFTEVEAQPWGNGQSWYTMISNEKNPHESVWGFHKTVLQKTFATHIAKTPCQTVTLWGSDFWLSADAMGIHWPMKSIAKLA